MKIITKRNLFFSIFCTLLLVSCTKDFENINKNVLLPDAQQKNLDGLASVGLFPGYIAGIIPTATTGKGTAAQNNYQVTSNMTGDIWSGYIGVGTQWDGGTSTPNFFIKDNRKTGIFNSMLLSIVNPFMDIKAATHDVEIIGGKQVYKSKDFASDANFAVAQIIKVMGMHRLTDLYGPIPYSKLEPGKLNVGYDSQEKVYRLMLQELKESVAKLVEYKESGGSKILNGYDPIFQGNTEKWIKLGNSLMLRLALRVRFVDEPLAKEYVSVATLPINGGLITTQDEAAKLVSNGTFRFFNSIYTLRTYNEANVGANLLALMNGYNDERRTKYFLQGDYGGVPGYYGVRMGVRKHKSDYTSYSVVNIDEATPTYWFKASEVQFLLAEARLANFISTGTAKEYYEAGIAMSFAENGLSVGNYATTSGVPAQYIDPRDNEYNHPIVSTINKKWEEVTDDEQHLEQIITQKYIANFPNGLEAWSEWRRTGYPRMFKEVTNLSNVGALSISSDGKSGGIRRVPFSLEEYTLNSENMPEAISLLGGVDNATTNVWWDKKTK